MKPHRSRFEFSDYPREYNLYSVTNKKVSDKFKDELNGVPIHQFIGLEPKMYSINTSNEEKKRAKKKLKHEDYVKCLETQTTTFEEQIRIGQ